MAAWSGLLRSTGQILLRGTRIAPKNLIQNGTNQVRLSSDHHRTFPLTPSRWQWHKTKDLLHLYALVGAIPCAIVAVLVHIFVGPAELQPIPDGYEPKHWEYYRDPISRFIARYMWTSPQQEYEKYLHMLYDESQIIEIRKLEDRIDDLMRERKDYKAYYYQPYNANYARTAHEVQHQRRIVEQGEY